MNVREEVLGIQDCWGGLNLISLIINLGFGMNFKVPAGTYVTREQLAVFILFGLVWACLGFFLGFGKENKKEKGKGKW